MTLQDRSSTNGQGFRTDPSIEDWSLLFRTRPNILVMGPVTAIDAFVHAVTPHFRSPVQSFLRGMLPPRFPSDGTLILREVDALNDGQQQQLIRWLEKPQNGHTQVISLTTTTLYLMVETRVFSDELYYRLNMVHLEVISD